MDFSKAFDKVGHQRLIKKLDYYGVRSKTRDWIQAFLANRTQQVIIRGKYSDIAQVQSGVPQGSVLGPCLFLFYINDLPQNLSSPVRLFADDTLLYLAVESIGDAISLQNDLRELENWESTWLMEFNTDKCQVLRVSRKRDPLIHEYILHGKILESVDSAQYLGVSITSDLCWNQHISNIVTKLTEESRHKLQSTENFIDAIKTIQIPDDHKLVSFDVKSLFTSIPLQLALDCTENAIKNSTAELPLPTDDIMDLLNLCLTSTYFQYNGKHYKQLHGTAMGSPVSVVVAEIVMQNIEEQALATYTRTIPIWLRYVDDTFTAVHKDGIDDFHEHLNRQNADIQFTKEIEENGKIPFLDCLVTRNNNKLQTTVYRKPTHTDRLLDQSSYNPTSHKATTIRTLTRRAQLVCDSPNSLQDETDYLYNVFSKNNYNTDFVRRNTHSNTDTQTNSGPVTTATVPYIRGTSETIARILQPYNIRVAHKPITTLRRLLTNVKDKDKPEDRQGAVYKIKCCDCQASYIGETGRNLSTRLTEHKRATRNGDVNNHIAEHHLQTKHQIDWDSATCITYSTDYHQRLTLESWFTNLEQTPLNRSQQLPAPYKRLIDGMKRN